MKYIFMWAIYCFPVSMILCAIGKIGDAKKATELFLTWIYFPGWFPILFIIALYRKIRLKESLIPFFNMVAKTMIPLED